MFNCLLNSSGTIEGETARKGRISIELNNRRSKCLVLYPLYYLLRYDGPAIEFSVRQLFVSTPTHTQSRIRSNISASVKKKKSEKSIKSEVSISSLSIRLLFLFVALLSATHWNLILTFNSGASLALLNPPFALYSLAKNQSIAVPQLNRSAVRTRIFIFPIIQTLLQNFWSGRFFP